MLGLVYGLAGADGTHNGLVDLLRTGLQDWKLLIGRAGEHERHDRGEEDRERRTEDECLGSGCLHLPNQRTTKGVVIHRIGCGEEEKVESIA